MESFHQIFSCFSQPRHFELVILSNPAHIVCFLISWPTLRNYLGTYSRVFTELIPWWNKSLTAANQIAVFFHVTVVYFVSFQTPCFGLYQKYLQCCFVKPVPEVKVIPTRYMSLEYMKSKQYENILTTWQLIVVCIGLYVKLNTRPIINQLMSFNW